MLYNITDDSDEGLEFPDGAVRADVIVPGQDKLVVKSHIDTDGGKVWKQKLEGNAMSFEEVYFMNADVDISEAQRLAKQAAKGVSTQLR